MNGLRLGREVDRLGRPGRYHVAAGRHHGSRPTPHLRRSTRFGRKTTLTRVPDEPTTVMTKEVTTVSTEGFASTTSVRNYTVDIDPSGETAPDTLESLLASYAACYMPALRVAAKQRDVGELGRVEIAVSGELNEDDKLRAIAFDIAVETPIDDDQGANVIERANELCKVHDAVKPELKAAMSIEGGSF